jgi:hypothetical protein
MHFCAKLIDFGREMIEVGLTSNAVGNRRLLPTSPNSNMNTRSVVSAVETLIQKPGNTYHRANFSLIGGGLMILFFLAATAVTTPPGRVSKS